ncbi:MAG: hypothetical protein AAF591_22805 [Verrucomicrobiota bacterium]
MKGTLLILIALYACFPCIAEDDLDSEFYDALDKVEAEYRAGKAALIRKADRAIVYLVDFGETTDENVFADASKSISIAPYDKRTKILKTREVEPKVRQELLDVLSAAIAEPEHTGGALCHYPIHGIRIYRGGELLHEGTFCWVCGNFGFSYPQGSTWLDTNAELKNVFMTLLPIPDAERERFRKKYAGAELKGERDGTTKAVERRVAE